MNSLNWVFFLRSGPIEGIENRPTFILEANKPVRKIDISGLSVFLLSPVTPLEG